jgi:hypothetical protein
VYMSFLPSLGSLLYIADKPWHGTVMLTLYCLPALYHLYLTFFVMSLNCTSNHFLITVTSIGYLAGTYVFLLAFLRSE